LRESAAVADLVLLGGQIDIATDQAQRAEEAGRIAVVVAFLVGQRTVVCCVGTILLSGEELDIHRMRERVAAFVLDERHERFDRASHSEGPSASRPCTMAIQAPTIATINTTAPIAKPISRPLLRLSHESGANGCAAG
jgi:hypothetical protein